MERKGISLPSLGSRSELMKGEWLLNSVKLLPFYSSPFTLSAPSPFRAARANFRLSGVVSGVPYVARAAVVLYILSALVKCLYYLSRIVTYYAIIPITFLLHILFTTTV